MVQVQCYGSTRGNYEGPPWRLAENALLAERGFSVCHKKASFTAYGMWPYKYCRNLWYRQTARPTLPQNKQQSNLAVTILRLRLSDILRRNAIVLDLFINKTVLRLRRVISHLYLVIDDIVHLSVPTQLLQEFADRDTT